MEVRFEGLAVDAQAYAAGRELPSIFNAYRNWVEACLNFLCDHPPRKVACILLRNVPLWAIQITGVYTVEGAP